MENTGFMAGSLQNIRSEHGSTGKINAIFDFIDVNGSQFPGISAYSATDEILRKGTGSVGIRYALSLRTKFNNPATGESLFSIYAKRVGYIHPNDAQEMGMKSGFELTGSLAENPIFNQENGQMVADIKINIPRRSNGKTSNELMAIRLRKPSLVEMIKGCLKDSTITLNGNIRCEQQLSQENGYCIVSIEATGIQIISQIQNIATNQGFNQGNGSQNAFNFGQTATQNGQAMQQNNNGMQTNAIDGYNNNGIMQNNAQNNYGYNTGTQDSYSNASFSTENYQKWQNNAQQAQWGNNQSGNDAINNTPQGVYEQNNANYGQQPQGTFGQNNQGMNQQPQGAFGQNNQGMNQQPQGTFGQNNANYGQQPQGAFGQNNQGMNQQPQGTFGQNNANYGQQPQGAFGQNNANYGQQPQGTFGQNNQGMNQQPQGTFGQNNANYGQQPQGAFGQNNANYGQQFHQGGNTSSQI